MPTTPFAPPLGGDDGDEFVPFADDELVAGFADAEHACLGGDPAAPQCFDDPGLADEDLLAMQGPVSEWTLVLLASIDPMGLDASGRLEYLRQVEAVEAMVAARKARTLVACAGTEGSDSTRDRQAALETAVLRRVGEGAAASSIATARGLHVEFPKFLAALAAGEVSEWHCRVLISGTVNVTDREVLAQLQERLLPKARKKTPAEFRREVAKAVADLDAEKETERFEAARADRYVSCKPLPDGMGYLGIVSDWPTISAMHAQVRAAGRTRQAAAGGAAAVRAGDDDARADACRADAFAALVLGTVQEDGSLCWDREQVQTTLTVVIDLDTLRGEAERHALVEGEPVPAEIGRQHAEAATLWRRAVSDPITGHLLDYGREQYLPDKLRDYVLARDHCRAPGCGVRSERRLHLEHSIPFPKGPTSAKSCGGMCGGHHDMKTRGLVDVEDSEADGSATWVTGWGQRISIPPRPFLHDPSDWAPPGNEEPPEPRKRRPSPLVEWDPGAPIDPDVPPF